MKLVIIITVLFHHHCKLVIFHQCIVIIIPALLSRYTILFVILFFKMLIKGHEFQYIACSFAMDKPTIGPSDLQG